MSFLSVKSNANLSILDLYSSNLCVKPEQYLDAIEFYEKTRLAARMMDLKTHRNYEFGTMLTSVDSGKLLTIFMKGESNLDLATFLTVRANPDEFKNLLSFAEGKQKSLEEYQVGLSCMGFSFGFTNEVTTFVTEDKSALVEDHQSLPEDPDNPITQVPIRVVNVIVPKESGKGFQIYSAAEVKLSRCSKLELYTANHTVVPKIVGIYLSDVHTADLAGDQYQEFKSLVTRLQAGKLPSREVPRACQLKTGILPVEPITTPYWKDLRFSDQEEVDRNAAAFHPPTSKRGKIRYKYSQFSSKLEGQVHSLQKRRIFCF